MKPYREKMMWHMLASSSWLNAQELAKLSGHKLRTASRFMRWMQNQGLVWSRLRSGRKRCDPTIWEYRLKERVKP
jgi:DNA-binding IclR family transcriptional regulator